MFEYQLSDKLIEELSIWIFLQDKQMPESYEAFEGIDFDTLPINLQEDFFKETNSSKSDFAEIIFHDFIGNVGIHKDKELFEMQNCSKVVLIPLRIIKQHIYYFGEYDEENTFIYFWNNEIKFTPLKVGNTYPFQADKEHGIMTSSRIMSLVLWVKEK